MTTRRALVFLVPMFLILLVSATGFLVMRMATSSGAAPAQLRGTVVWPMGTRKAEPFALKDQTGRVVNLTSLRGRISVVTFLNSHCKEACPVEGRELAITQRELGRHSPLNIVVISVAPALDTPGSTRAFMHKSGMTGSWHWLMGTREQLAPVWKAWGTSVNPTPHDILHTDAVYLIDQKGFVRVADAVPFRTKLLADSVRALEKA